jgi:hypothetical protein
VKRGLKLPWVTWRSVSAMPYALARRVAHETLNEHGGEIAYKIRFDTTREEGGGLQSSTFQVNVCRFFALRPHRNHPAYPAEST